MLRMAKGPYGNQDTDLEREAREGEDSKDNNQGHWDLHQGVGNLVGKGIAAVEAGLVVEALDLMKASRLEGEEGTYPGDTWVV